MSGPRHAPGRSLTAHRYCLKQASAQLSAMVWH